MKYRSSDDQVEIDQRRMAKTRTRRRDWTGFGGSADQAISKETGGCWSSAESGNRGEPGVMASLAYIPEVAEEEARLVQNDRLRQFVSEEDNQLFFDEDGAVNSVS